MKNTFVILVSLILSCVYSIYGQDLAQSKLILDTEGEPRSVAFSPDGNILATTSGTKTTIWLWNTSTGRPVKKLSTGKDPANYVGKSNYLLVMPRVGYTQLGFSPDGRLLAVFSQVTNDVRLWDIQTGKLYMTLIGIKYMMSVEFSPDGRLLALALGEQGLKLLDVYSGQLLTTKWDFKHVDSVTGADFSKDGKTLVLGIASAKDAESGFYFIDVATGKIRASILSPASHDLNGQISPDRGSIATFENSSNDIKVWDMMTGQLKSTIVGSKSKINQLSFSYDGRTIAAITKDGRVQLWDIETSAPKVALQKQESKMKFVAFFPSGKAILSIDTKGLKIWDASTGTLTQSLIDAHEPLTFSPDGQLLVTASKRGVAQVWQILR